jgi:hypothetical protein
MNTTLENQLKELSIIKYDKCVICGMDTPYTSNTHIDYRVGYIEGAGQGCFKVKKCEQAKRIY